MVEKTFSNELQRVLARPDADDIIRHIQDYYEDFQAGVGKWTDEKATSFDAIMDAGFHDPEKSLAYAIAAMTNYDDEPFLYYVAAGPLENSLQNPPDDLVERVIAEGRRTPRFRWLLNGVYSHAIREDVAERIQNELGLWVEEFPAPPRPWA